MFQTTNQKMFVIFTHSLHAVKPLGVTVAQIFCGTASCAKGNPCVSQKPGVQHGGRRVGRNQSGETKRFSFSTRYICLILLVFPFTVMKNGKSPALRIFGKTCGLIKYISVASTKVTVSYRSHLPFSFCSQKCWHFNGGFPVRKLRGCSKSISMVTSLYLHYI